MRVADVARAMEAIAPARFAAAWDNVGLLVGDPAREVRRVLLAVDCTRAVLDEAVRTSCGAVVAYHPPIFDAQKRFVAGSIGYEAARAGVALYSPHTALDVAAGGTNDVLADAIGMTGRAPLRAVESADAEHKLVTFVPGTHVEALAAALGAAGAGTIGNYTSCSFRTAGTGTFFGEEGARPVVGSAGRLEHVDEVRLEMVVPVGGVAAAVRALRAAHPYEEPAFDLVRLAAAPAGLGFGRVGDLAATTVGALVEHIKTSLGVAHVLVAGGFDRPASRAAVCAGSGGDLVPDAIGAGAHVFVTGELRHHDALRATAAGMGVVCVLHSASERAALPRLARLLTARLPELDVALSVEDREPFSFA
ncbi:MAG TPA: Nif3-like dinuclear metal center hexameric protein [Polyangiaceae bacterium]|jgi:dinuclear metal center YbgI/SA1388 family protein